MSYEDLAVEFNENYYQKNLTLQEVQELAQKLNVQGITLTSKGLLATASIIWVNGCTQLKGELDGMLEGISYELQHNYFDINYQNLI